MGMDCNGFVVVRVPTAQDVAWYEAEGCLKSLPGGNNIFVEEFPLTSEAYAELNQMFGQTFPGELCQYLNTEKLEEDLKIPALTDYAYDLSQETGWIQIPATKSGEPSTLVEVKSADYLYADGLYQVQVVVQRTSYMRKPFRKDYASGSRMEGDTLVLSSDNFAGADVNALNALLEMDVAERYSKVLMPSNIELARALRAHTDNPSEWDIAVIDVLQDPRGIVYLDW